MDDGSQDQMQGDDESQEQGAGGDAGFTVCIKVDGQGKISVGSYPNSADDNDADDDSDDYKPAANIKEALTEALALFRAGGDDTDDEGNFSSGFASKTKATAAGSSTYDASQE